MGEGDVAIVLGVVTGKSIPGNISAHREPCAHGLRGWESSPSLKRLVGR